MIDAKAIYVQMSDDSFLMLKEDAFEFLALVGALMTNAGQGKIENLTWVRFTRDQFLGRVEHGPNGAGSEDAGEDSGRGDAAGSDGRPSDATARR